MITTDAIHKIICWIDQLDDAEIKKYAKDYLSFLLSFPQRPRVLSRARAQIVRCRIHTWIDDLFFLNHKNLERFYREYPKKISTVSLHNISPKSTHKKECE